MELAAAHDISKCFLPFKRTQLRFHLVFTPSLPLVRLIVATEPGVIQLRQWDQHSALQKSRSTTLGSCQSFVLAPAQGETERNSTLSASLHHCPSGNQHRQRFAPLLGRCAGWMSEVDTLSLFGLFNKPYSFCSIPFFPVRWLLPHIPLSRRLSGNSILLCFSSAVSHLPKSFLYVAWV